VLHQATKDARFGLGPSSASSARRTCHGGIPKRSAKGLQPTTVRLSELAPSARVTEPHRVVGFEVVLGALLAAGDRGVVSGNHLLGEERHGLLGEVAAGRRRSIRRGCR